jgi:hypothetical protein
VRAGWGALALLVATVGVVATGPGVSALQTRAVLEGRGIPLRRVVRHHCHDAQRPVIRCFRSRLARDGHLRALASDPYVEVFVDADYGGGSMVASGPITNLGAYGWNDAITSFHSIDGGRPKFWEHAGYDGASWRWSAGASIANVGGNANDRFSSVKHVP